MVHHGMRICEDFIRRTNIQLADEPRNRLLDWLAAIQGIGRLEALHDIVDSCEWLWKDPLLRHYTGHGIEHSSNIVAKITTWLNANHFDFTAQEAFIFLGSTYLHDIGMQCRSQKLLQTQGIYFTPEQYAAPGYEGLEEIRRRHNELSALMIIDACRLPGKRWYPEFPLNCTAYSTEAQDMMNIARYHTGTICEVPESIRHATNIQPFTHETVRLMLLIHLLRIGNALDADYRRINMEFLKYYIFDELPLITRFHILKHAMVKQVGIHGIGEFLFSYRLPSNDMNFFADVRRSTEQYLKEHWLACAKELNIQGIAFIGIDARWEIALTPDYPINAELRKLFHRESDRDDGNSSSVCRLNEVKLILVGRGRVGKTCLIKRLIHNSFNELEPETPGIEIQPWDIILDEDETVHLHVWDFGGQEILHATHQFFLTERTIYLLVLSGREGNATEDAEYWLQLIRSFGGDSRVIIVLNKSREHPFDVNRGLLLEKYSSIVDFICTDCSDAFNLLKLRQLIREEIFVMEHRKKQLPANWFAIKDRLASMPEYFLTWEQYQDICCNMGVREVSAQRELAGYLNVLGIALNYYDDPRLCDKHVLKPRWVTEGIYSLLRAGQKERKAVLTPGDLQGILDATGYPVSSHDFLLQLMVKFKLCFRMPGNIERYLMPELLGESQPDEVRPLLMEPGLGFRYQYDVLPEGLMPRFIVQTHIYSEMNPNWRWRSGVVLERDGCRAVVRGDARERRVDIHITGLERQRRELLGIIRDRFDEQHWEMKGLRVEERVPLPGTPGLTVSFRDLVKREQRGELTFYPENHDYAVSVPELLNGIEYSTTRRVQRTRESVIMRGEDFMTVPSSYHVFRSHNSQDKTAVRELKDLLASYGLTVWLDEDELRPGIPWQELLESGIKASTSVVVLVGADGLGPWEDEEMQGALRLAVKDRRPVIPVLLPGAASQPDLPMFLGNRTWVDLRSGFTADGLGKLVWGITGKKP